ncbi:MAG: hypothetical protein D6748_01355 [Calditrichaeota bacterium]|nr:MAG: hypothetical protein D6748_01355 [Calditrichota bacterium]
MDKSDVSKAFNVLLEILHRLTAELNEQGARAFQAGDYKRAVQAAKEAQPITEFQKKVQSLLHEWERIASGAQRTERRASRRVNLGRLPHGLCTPEDAFRRPLLEALVELGGSAPSNVVLQRIGEKMKPVLTEYDYQTVPSDPSLERWKKRAQWCRYLLVQEGLMRSDSPRGIWEISEAGRQALLRMKEG